MATKVEKSRSGRRFNKKDPRFEPNYRKRGLNLKYKHEGFQFNPPVNEYEDEYFEEKGAIDRAWERDLMSFNKGRMPNLSIPHKKLNRHQAWIRYKKKVHYHPESDNENFEESHNPNDYTERDYRPGFEGGEGYPKSGIYGHYGDYPQDYRGGFQGTESQSPYGSGYQFGESYEGEHGYGSREDLGGKKRESY